MVRPDKAAAVDELTRAFESSNAGVLTEYRGLTVAQLKQLRTAIGSDGSYAVVKNTLTAIAARNAGIDAFEGQLTGPSAIAFVTGDPVGVAKGLRTFARANPALVVKGGYLDGRPLTAAEVSSLADLESREVLLAKMAGAMKASLTRAAYVVAAPLSKAVRTVDALREQREAAGGSPGATATDADAPVPDADAAPGAASAADEAPAPDAAEAAAAVGTAAQ